MAQFSPEITETLLEALEKFSVQAKVSTSSESDGFVWVSPPERGDAGEWVNRRVVIEKQNTSPKETTMSTWAQIGASVQSEIDAFTKIKGHNHSGASADKTRNTNIANHAARMNALASRLREEADRLTEEVAAFAGLAGSEDHHSAIKDEIAPFVSELAKASCLMRVKLAGTKAAVYFHGMRYICPEACSHDEPYGVGLVIEPKKWKTVHETLGDYGFVWDTAAHSPDYRGVGKCPDGPRDYHTMIRLPFANGQIPMSTSTKGPAATIPVRLILTCNPEAAYVCHSANHMAKRLKVIDKEDAAMLHRLILDSKFEVAEMPGRAELHLKDKGLIGYRFYHIWLQCEDGEQVHPQFDGEVVEIDGHRFAAGSPPSDSPHKLVWRYAGKVGEEREEKSTGGLLVSQAEMAKATEKLKARVAERMYAETQAVKTRKPRKKAQA